MLDICVKGPTDENYFRIYLCSVVVFKHLTFQFGKKNPRSKIQRSSFQMYLTAADESYQQSVT